MNYVISKKQFEYLRDLIAKNQSNTDEKTLIQLVVIQGKFVILNIRSVVEKSNKYFIQALEQIRFSTLEEAKKCLNDMRILLNEGGDQCGTTSGSGTKQQPISFVYGQLKRNSEIKRRKAEA